MVAITSVVRTPVEVILALAGVDVGPAARCFGDSNPEGCSVVRVRLVSVTLVLCVVSWDSQVHVEF